MTDGSDDRPGEDADVERLRQRLDAVEARLDERTVHRDDLEADLRHYVRRRLRRGHARGWGPYLVLLYGTVMTLGAFYYLSGGWAILAMVVVWLSTLGLFVVFVVAGTALGAASTVGRLAARLRRLRE